MAKQEIERIEIDPHSAQSSFFDVAGEFVIGDPVLVVKSKFYDIEGGTPVNNRSVREVRELEKEVDETDRLIENGREVLKNLKRRLDE